MAKEDELPDGPLIAFYGDDFTGATAVMEVMSFSGLPAVLFLDVPTRQQLARFSGYRAIGIAGTARSRSPQWMDEALPPVFRALAALCAPLVHYKFCTTLDSAPHVGSIGRAIDIAMPIVGSRWCPIIVAAPRMHRYQAFGNVFALGGDDIHRLDRHPTMSRHPVTQMDEADVRAHLGRQTDREIGLINLAALNAGRGDEVLAASLAADTDTLAIDLVDDATLVEAGRLVWENRGERLFSAASQGLEYALTAYWRGRKLIGPQPASPAIGAVERLPTVSGSCAPVTGGQIEWALSHGFAGIRIDLSKSIDAQAWNGEIERVAGAALKALGEGWSPLAFTAIGPEDTSIPAFNEAIRTSGASLEEANRRIGNGLGVVLERVLREGGLRRGAVAGGDSSGHAAGRLGIYALEALAPLADGAPLCRAHRDDPGASDLEIVLKGGQMGPPDFLGRIKTGGG